MRRLLLLSATLGMVLLVASPAFAQSGADGGFNCIDFATQEEAQAFFDADPSDPDGLDGPPGDAFTGEPGVACEELPSGGGGAETVAPDDGDPLTLEGTCEGIVLQEDFEACIAAQQPAPEVAPAEVAPEVAPTAEALPSESITVMPDTGGPSMLLPLSALLVGAGLVGLAVVRRR